MDEWLYDDVDNREDYMSAMEAVAKRYKLRTYDSGSFALRNADVTRWREFVDSYLKHHIDGDRKTWQQILVADLAVTSLALWLDEDDERTVTKDEIQIAESYMTRMRTDRVLSAFVRQMTTPNDPGSILPETYPMRELALKLGFWDV
ncbi:MAG: hypothetical protein ACK5RX_10995 [bacterium]